MKTLHEVNRVLHDSYRNAVNVNGLIILPADKYGDILSEFDKFVATHEEPKLLMDPVKPDDLPSFAGHEPSEDVLTPANDVMPDNNDDSQAVKVPVEVGDESADSLSTALANSAEPNSEMAGAVGESDVDSEATDEPDADETAGESGVDEDADDEPVDTESEATDQPFYSDEPNSGTGISAGYSAAKSFQQHRQAIEQGTEQAAVPAGTDDDDDVVVTTGDAIDDTGNDDDDDITLPGAPSESESLDDEHPKFSLND